MFETNWLYWIAGLALAGILFHLGRLRQDRHLRQAALVVAGLVVVWAILAFLLITPRERLYRAHQAMAQAAQANDVDKVLSYLGDDFECSALGIEIPKEAKGELSQRLKSYNIKSNNITGYSSELTGSTAGSRVTLITRAGDLPPVKTTWQLTWEDVPGQDWKIERAELRRLNDNPVPAGPVLPPSLPQM